MFRTARYPRLVFNLPALGTLTLAGLLLSGCEQTRPPTPEGLKLIRQRTASGTLVSKLESRSQPRPPRAGEISIWDFKIFEAKDKPDGTRTERKFFAPLPQNSTKGGTTDVLMNAWIISDDLTAFQPAKPSYKAYGSFVTGWTIAKPGSSLLWVEYQPSERGKFFNREMARWQLTAAPSSNADYQPPRPMLPQTVTRQGTDETFAALDANGSPSHEVALHYKTASAPQRRRFEWQVKAPSDIEGMNVVALSPDRKRLLHWVATSVNANFAQPGDWHLWFCFEVNGVPFIAPYILKIAQ